jgi:hypothetical protein
MSLDYLRRLHAGFALAIGVTDVAPCESFHDSRSIDEKYWGMPVTADFPNPWHVGTLGSAGYLDPRHIIQSELEMLVFMFGLVVQLKPKLVFESGTNVGLLSRALGAACWVNGFGRVVTCDTDHRMTDYAEKVCEGLPVEVLWSPALKVPELEEADLVYIDSSYQSSRTSPGFACASRVEEVKKVKSGATFVVHDTFAEQWLRACMKDEEMAVHLEGPRGFTVARKT